MTAKPVYVVSDEEIASGAFSLQGGPAVTVRGWGSNVISDRNVQGGARVPVYVVNDNAAVLAQRGVQGRSGGDGVLLYDVTDAATGRDVQGRVAIPVYVVNRDEWPDTVSPPFVRAGHTTKLDEADTNSHVIDTPTHSPGDLLAVFVGSDAPGDTISATDFSPLSGGMFDTTSLTGAVLLKTAGASEPGTITVTTAATERCAMVAIAIANQGGIDELASPSTGEGNTVTLSAITPNVENTLCIRAVIADRNATPMGALAEFTKVTDVGIASAASVGVYYKQLSGTDEVAAGAVTISDLEQWIGLSFTIAPA